MGRPVALVFAMPPVGHFNRLRPVIPALVDAGLDVVVATHERFRGDVERSGARFFDLFERFPLEGLDEASQPPPVRFVTYAGHYGAEIAADLAELAPNLVVYDTFAVVGRVVASALQLPYVNVCSGHDRVPARVVDGYRSDPRVSVSPACQAAIVTLREDHGLDDVTHLSWVSGVSPYLNLYGEPPQFLSDEGRQAFAPLDYFGCLSVGRERQPAGDPWPGARSPGRRRVFVSLGSVGWRLFHADTQAALEAVVDALAGRDDVEGLVSLGEPTVADGPLRSLTRPNVAVRAWVDQWDALARADVFVTHAGLNSVHEAVYQRVPMVAYPLFADQPSLARIAGSLGIAVPLVEGVRGPVTPDDVNRALESLERDRVTMAGQLEAVRRSELDVIEGRPGVARRIAALAAAHLSARLEARQPADGAPELVEHPPRRSAGLLLGPERALGSVGQA